MFSRGHSDYDPPGCDVWQVGRLPRSPRPTGTSFERWFATDSEANYGVRGNPAFPVDSVGYQFNTLGYRGEEFVRNGDEALVMFVGDSNTLGVGIPWEKVWTSLVCARLETLWDRPVRQCNFGWKGTGPDYAAMIVHQSIEALWPDAVFVLWSYVARLAWFPEPRRQVHFMPNPSVDADAWEQRDHEAYLRLATESQGFFNFVRDFHLVDSRLAAHRIPFFWGDQDRMAPELLRGYVPLSGYVGPWTRVDGDLARDGFHAGVHSHAQFAASVIDTIERDKVVPADVGRFERTGGLVPAPAGAEASPSAGTLPRPPVPKRVSAAAAELKVRRRIRALRRKDPFIY
jgi:hypothetical protein